MQNLAPNKWDIRFLQLAKTVASWSKDPSTQTGALIVRHDKSVVSLGFNGFAKSMVDDPELYANREEKYSRIIHCEVNALIQARQSVQGCTLYTWPFMCCERCAVQMIQAGIARFIYPAATENALTRWGKSFEKTQNYFHESGVHYQEIADLRVM